MENRIQNKIMSILLDHMAEGVHVIDQKGYTLAYNRAMERIEGLISDEVVGKHISEIFPRLDHTRSTLLQAIEHNQVIENYHQEYTNLRGERITTVNNTYPIMVNGVNYGAVEFSRNTTDERDYTDQVHKLMEGEINQTKPNYYTFDMIIGSSKLMQQALRIARRCAETDATVLIVGQTGTGKEMFAQSIHNASRRKHQRFIGINCAALPDSILESLLFGTVKGAFTGSVDRIGLFEQADRGSLFLDEINSLSANLQAKLLRVLQEGFVRRVGGTKDQPINVRMIAATNQSPSEQVEQGTLRRDLYYRLNVMRLDLPPLVQRPDDIMELAELFIEKYSRKADRVITGMSQDFQDALKRHEFRGNVRELEHLIEASIHLKENDGQLELSDLPDHFYRNMDDQLLGLYRDDQPLTEYLAEIERNLIQSAYFKERGNVSNAAKRLGLPRQNLQYKLKKYDII